MGTEDGIIIEGELPYEDLKSFKIDLKNHNYQIQVTDFLINQATDGAATPVEPEAVDGLTIADIGNTELTLCCAMNEDTVGSTYDGKTVTVYYYTKAGVLTGPCVATINGTNDTEVAFNPVITDFYMFDPDQLPTTNAVLAAGKYIYIGVTGLAAGDVMCTIGEAETTALAENCYGVGSVWGGAEEDAANLEDAYMEGDYINYLFQLKHMKMVYDDTATTVVRFQEATLRDGVYTVTGKYVNDFYRRAPRLRTSVVPAAGKNVFVCDHDSSNYYAVIQPLYKRSIHSHYAVRDESAVDTYLAYFSFVYQVAAEYCTLDISGVGADIGTFAHPAVSKDLERIVQDFPPIKLEKGTELTFLLTDDGATGGNAQLRFVIIEAWK